MDKPPDDSASKSEPQPEPTGNRGNQKGDTASAPEQNPEDFLLSEEEACKQKDKLLKEWEKNGRPTGSTLGLLFQIDEASKAGSVSRVMKELGSLSPSASAALEGIKATAASLPSSIFADSMLAAETLSSWKGIGESALRIMRDDPSLFTGALGNTEALLQSQLSVLKVFADPNLQEPVKRAAEAFEHFSFLKDIERSEIEKRALEQMALFASPTALGSIYAFPLRQKVTEGLARAAIRQIRQTDPSAQEPQTAPTGTSAKGAEQTSEDTKAREKTTSKKGNELVDTAAKSLALIDAELRARAVIVRTAAEWEMLRDWKTKGKDKDIALWLNGRAQEAVRVCKEHLGIQRGRNPKPEREKTGYKLALMVEAHLPEIKKWMTVKDQSKKKRIPRERLLALGCPKDMVDCVRDCREPVAAACHYVAKVSEVKRAPSTIQNHYSKFRRLLPPALTPPEHSPARGIRTA